MDVKVLLLTLLMLAGLMILVESPSSLQTPPEKRHGNSTIATAELYPSHTALSLSSSSVWSTVSPLSQTSTTSLIPRAQQLEERSYSSEKQLQTSVHVNRTRSKDDIFLDYSDKARDTEIFSHVSKPNSVLQQSESVNSSTDAVQNRRNQSSKTLNGHIQNPTKVRMKRSSLDADPSIQNNLNTTRSKKKNKPNLCKPIPETVLWKRIDPSEYYLTMQARESSGANEPIQSAAKSKSASRAKNNGRKRNSLETHSKRTANSRDKRSSRKPNGNSLKETSRRSDEINLNSSELLKSSVKKQSQQDDQVIKSKVRRQQLQSSVVDNEKATDSDQKLVRNIDLESNSFDQNEDLIDSSTNTFLNLDKPLPRQKSFFSKKQKHHRRDRNGSASKSRARRATSTELLQKRYKRLIKRQHSNDISNAKLGLHCRLETFWETMPFGVYPQYVKNGRCSSKLCMGGFYDCVERRYAVNIMRKNEGLCNPLPLVSNEPNVTTTLEESWTLEHHDVVVACECSRPRAAGVSRRTPRRKHHHSSAETSITQRSSPENASTAPHRQNESPP